MPDPAVAPSKANAAALADTFVDLMRTFTRVKAKLVENAQNDVEWAANILLRSLVLGGPMRASALAESVQSDLSTVSRQVAPMVKAGLLERRADQVDGRASLLVPTAAGRAVVEQHDEARTEYFSEVVADWTEEELDQFLQQLHRFSADYDRMNKAWLAQRSAELARQQSTVDSG